MKGLKATIRMKRITDLMQRECRWPVGENDDGCLFCGRATPEGLSYCLPHGRKSTATGRAPTPRAPAGEPVMPAPRRSYLDRACGHWFHDREPDAVELVEKGPAAYHEYAWVKIKAAQASRERGER